MRLPSKGETAAFHGPHDFNLDPLEMAQIILAQPTSRLEERNVVRNPPSTGGARWLARHSPCRRATTQQVGHDLILGVGTDYHDSPGASRLGSGRPSLHRRLVVLYPKRLDELATNEAASRTAVQPPRCDPGPASALTERASSGSPQCEHTGTARDDLSAGHVTDGRWGSSAAAAQRSPQLLMAVTTPPLPDRLQALGH